MRGEQAGILSPAANPAAASHRDRNWRNVAASGALRPVVATRSEPFRTFQPPGKDIQRARVAQYARDALATVRGPDTA